jgi:hypothetical protein
MRRERNVQLCQRGKLLSAYKNHCCSPTVEKNYYQNVVDTEADKWLSYNQCGFPQVDSSQGLA